MISQERCFSYYIPLTDQISLSDCLYFFPSWDIKQQVYCNCLYSKLRRHRFWNCPYLSSLSFNPFLLHAQNVKTIIQISRERKELFKYFLSPLNRFNLPKTQVWECTFNALTGQTVGIKSYVMFLMDMTKCSKCIFCTKLKLSFQFQNRSSSKKSNKH